MNDNLCLLAFIFIILIFIALFFSDKPGIVVIILIASAILVGYMFNYQELFTSPQDDYEISKYGNISTSEDIDMTRQEMPMNLNIPYASPESDKIDNSDVIEMAITRGTTLFQPNGQGFSPLNGIVPTPSIFAKYDIPLSGQQNADEMLARKQQQRAATSKRSLDGAVRATRDLFCKYFQEELDENEHRVWYSSEAQDVETDWEPY